MFYNNNNKLTREQIIYALAVLVLIMGCLVAYLAISHYIEISKFKGIIQNLVIQNQELLEEIKAEKLRNIQLQNQMYGIIESNKNTKFYANLITLVGIVILGGALIFLYNTTGGPDGAGEIANSITKSVNNLNGSVNKINTDILESTISPMSTEAVKHIKMVEVVNNRLCEILLDYNLITKEYYIFIRNLGASENYTDFNTFFGRFIHSAENLTDSNVNTDDLMMMSEIVENTVTSTSMNIVTADSTNTISQVMQLLT